MKTLYVLDRGSRVDVKADRFQVFCQQARREIPISQVRQIVILAICSLSRRATVTASQHGIPIAFIGDVGQLVSVVESENTPPPKSRFYQQQCALNCEFVRETAETILRSKLHNASAVLQQLNFGNVCEEAIAVLDGLREDLPMATSISDLREIQTTADRTYDTALMACLDRHPGNHRGNCRFFMTFLLNLGKALLHQELAIKLPEVGLDPEFGHLHFYLEWQKPLVCDLMADLQYLVVDTWVTQHSYFSSILPEFEGNCDRSMLARFLDRLIQSWEKNLQTIAEIERGKSVTYSEFLEVRVREYLGYVMGEVEGYRSVLMQWNDRAIPRFERSDRLDAYRLNRLQRVEELV